MQNEIIQYDRMGFVPSRSVKCIDDYLREAEKKQRILDDFQTGRVIYPFASDYEVRSLHVNSQEYFEEKFNTLPLPALLFEEGTMRRALKSRSIKDALTYSDSKEGGTVCIDKETGFRLPVIEKERTSSLHGSIEHETIHAIRCQWYSNPLLRHSQCLSEEVMAYNALSRTADMMDRSLWFDHMLWAYSNFCNLKRLLPPLVGAGTAVAYGSGWIGGAAVFLFIPISEAIAMNLQVNRGIKLMEKSQDEGLNFHYLYLRSGLYELGLSSPLEEQIAKKEGTKWDVIRTRLGISESN